MFFLKNKIRMVNCVSDHGVIRLLESRTYVWHVGLLGQLGDALELLVCGGRYDRSKRTPFLRRPSHLTGIGACEPEQNRETLSQ